MLTRSILICSILFLAASCSDDSAPEQSTESNAAPSAETTSVKAGDPPKEKRKPRVVEMVDAEERLASYASVELTADLSGLTENQKAMVGYLIDASRIIDHMFWKQSYGDRQQLLQTLSGAELELAKINYGPWDRLSGDAPFVEGVGPKPLGAQFYKRGVTNEQIEKLPAAKSLYHYVTKNERGRVRLVPYHYHHRKEIKRLTRLLMLASELAEDPEFANYLQLRVLALQTDDYKASDLAWLDMKNNKVDVIIGPIETYEDQRFGYKAAYESYVLIKDLEWSERLSRFAQFLPQLQQSLPVGDAYKQETPGTNSDLNAYDAVFFAGRSNAGSKTIAVNLPNDEQVQLEKGTRRLQLKNVMRAKFDQILLPLSDVLIAADQRRHITFNAFFANTMFHEVAHGLGIKNTINGNGTVREALKELASPMEEGKADILGLHMIGQLFERGEMEEGEIMDHYVTFLAGIFRSVRFGASSAHGRANMVRYNYFRDAGAFSRNPEDGTYRVNQEEMTQAIADLSRLLLTLQGDGDYEATAQLMAEKGVVPEQLQTDLDRLKDVPVDIVFKQGRTVLGLPRRPDARPSAKG